MSVLCHIAHVFAKCAVELVQKVVLWREYELADNGCIS